MSTLAKVFGIPVLVVGFVAVAALWNGYALSILWGWFAVPIFGLRPLSIPEAIGLALIVGFLTKQHIPQDEDKGWESAGYVLANPALALLVGWIVTKFM